MEHADKAHPGVFTTVFGERHELISNFSTLVIFEAATKKCALDPRTWVNPSATDVVTLIWAALGGESFRRRNDKGQAIIPVTMEDVAGEIRMAHMGDLKELISVMFKQAAVPEEEKKAAAA